MKNPPVLWICDIHFDNSKVELPVVEIEELPKRKATVHTKQFVRSALDQ